MSVPSWASHTTRLPRRCGTNIPWGRGSFLRISCGERQPLTLPSPHRGEEKGEGAVTGQGASVGESMRIALDVSPLARNRAGVGTYVAHLLMALVRIAPEHEFFLYTPHRLPAEDYDFFSAHSHVHIIQCPAWLMRLRSWWERVDLFH